MSGTIAKKIEKALGSPMVKSRPLRGGDIADVSLITLADDRQFVAKRPRMDQPDTTACEKMMLTYLAKQSALPVPKVQYQTRELLVMDYIHHTGTDNATAVAEDAAKHIAHLHAVEHLPRRGKPKYGFDKDTYIGPLVQQNKPADCWVDFFREHRLMAMAESSHRTQKLPLDILKKVHSFAGKLDQFLPKDPKASLLHGDLWAGNMLVDGDHVAAFIDPAISYGHHEMDLAFIDLMGGFDTAFFDAYSALSSIDQDFWDTRKRIYQLWPLLVHVRIFGGGYVQQVDSILDHFL